MTKSRSWIAGLALAYLAAGLRLAAFEITAPAQSAFRISPGDTLQVDVWKEPDASTPPAVVRPDGQMSLAMIGELRVGGLTTHELENALTEKYRTFIRNPRVSVIVRQISISKAYVIGEVRREGPVRLETSLTVLQALAEAGGLTDYAKRKKIYILREIDGRRAIIRFDYDTVVRGGNPEQNITIIAGDTIVVPR